MCLHCREPHLLRGCRTWGFCLPGRKVGHVLTGAGSGRSGLPWLAIGPNSISRSSHWRCQSFEKITGKNEPQCCSLRLLQPLRQLCSEFRFLLLPSRRPAKTHVGSGPTVLTEALNRFPHSQPYSSETRGLIQMTDFASQDPELLDA
ncbi:hypothetical protein LIA77_08101 [Sarocladium implicatum]|nr:hypothetical protein LIA77_08101 [Sarocladium implicatum]